jgi:uncharacterized protein YcaQ
LPSKNTLSLQEARVIALAAQGFADPLPKGTPDIRAMRRVFKRVGVVQIDSVNVLERAHYLPFLSRLGPYRRELLGEKAFKRRELYEYWAHAAALIPMWQYPLHRWRMERNRDAPWWKAMPKPLVDRVFKEIDDRGAQSISTLSDKGSRSGAWWGWSDAKMALEMLFTTGRLAVSGRGPNFERIYDLPERVIPTQYLDKPAVPEEEARKQLLLLGAQSMGVATVKDLDDYYRLRLYKTKMPPLTLLLDELVEEKQLTRVDVEGWKVPGYMAPGIQMPVSVERDALVSPFDSLIWFRERTERLFGLHYRIEIYVPAPKRVHGYYVLPFLMGADFTARVDLKAERKASGLIVKSAYLEPGHNVTETSARLAASLKEVARWLNLDRVVVERKGDLAAALKRAVASK